MNETETRIAVIRDLVRNHPHRIAVSTVTDLLDALDAANENCQLCADSAEDGWKLFHDEREKVATLTAERDALEWQITRWKEEETVRQEAETAHMDRIKTLEAELSLCAEWKEVVRTAIDVSIELDLSGEPLTQRQRLLSLAVDDFTTGGGGQ
jgi:hypothetical protein